MKTTAFLISLCLSFGLMGQYEYEPSSANPYGQPNPNGPVQLNDWKPLIGLCKCKSVSRLNQNTWADTVDMLWKFKYIMNGMGVQDETLKEDGVHSGSIRQFNADSSKWYVHYYSNGGVTSTLSSWEGNKTESGDIVLYRKQNAPTGQEGYYRLTFFNISKDGFNWAGEWVNLAETFVYPTWKIFCNKIE